MSDSSSAHPLPPLSHPGKLVWGGLLGISVLAGLAAAQFSWLWAAAPLILAVSLASILWPRFGIMLLVTALYFRFSLPMTRGYYPADVLTFVVIVGVILGRIASGERLFVQSWVNPIVLVVLLVFSMSLVEAHDMANGLRNLARHVQLFALMVVIASGTTDDDAHRIIRWMLFMTAAISVINITTFLAAGGTIRVFGLPGAFFSLYAVLGCLHAGIGFVTTEEFRTRLGWSALFVLFFAGLIATQTRAALMQVGFGLILMITIIWFWSRSRAEHRLNRRVFLLVASLVIMVVVLMAGVVPFLHNPAERILSALEGRSVTVAYRLFLWKTGLRAFMESPILGMGLGQISTWEEVFSSWRFDPMSVHTRGLGAHNDFITYLAETGLAGTMALFWLFWRVITTGATRLRQTTRTVDFAHVLHIWVPSVTIIIGYFFSTHMFYSLAGMMTAIYFGLWVRHTRDASSMSHS